MYMYIRYYLHVYTMYREPYYETVRNEKRLSISTPDIPSFSDVPTFDTPSPTPVVPSKTVTSKQKVSIHVVKNTACSSMLYFCARL